MSPQQNCDFFPNIDQHLQALGKFACAVLTHGVSTTIHDKIECDPDSKFAYQLMLVQHFTSSITSYKRNKSVLKGVLVDGKKKAGRFKKMFVYQTTWGIWRSPLSGWMETIQHGDHRGHTTLDASPSRQDGRNVGG